jgi:OmpA-OmpF porin, OOP family
MKRHVAAGAMLAGLGLIWGSAAQAEDNGWYFGLSGGLTSSSMSKSDFDNSLTTDLTDAVAAQGLTLVDFALDSDFDDSDKGWGLHIGYRFNRWVATEVGYLDLGKFIWAARADLSVDAGAGPQQLLVDEDARVTASGPFASVLGIFAINDRFNAHVRGGLLFADTRARLRAVAVDAPETFTSTEFKSSSSDVFAGIGATWNINDSYSLRLEYQKFLDVGDDQTNESDIDYINLAVLFR